MWVVKFADGNYCYPKMKRKDVDHWKDRGVPCGPELKLARVFQTKSNAKNSGAFSKRVEDEAELIEVELVKKCS